MTAAAASPPALHAARRERLWAAMLAVVVLLAYAPALRDGFVWDDVLHIADNPRVHSVGAVAGYLSRPEGAYYRPLVFVSYGFEWAMWGATPFGYHAVNVLLHIANTLLLLRLARRSGAGATAALIGASVFALHPVQTDAVAYVSGRTDLWMTTGALLSCLALFGEGTVLARGLGAAAGGALAMLSKESGYALVFVSAWVVCRHVSGWRARLALLVPGLCVAAVLLALRPGGVPMPSAALDWTGLAAAGRQLLVYAGVLLWPAALQIDRLTAVPSSGWEQASGASALMVGLALVLYGLRLRGAAADWTAWTVAFYLPVANLIALYPSIAERALFTPEHNLYAPLAGLGVLAGIGVERLVVRLAPPRRRAALAAVALLLAGWALRSALRCAVWRDEETLFGSAVAAGSASPRVWYNYGNALLRRGADAQAADAFAGAVQRGPLDAAIWTNLGVARQRLRAYDSAESAYRRAAELSPRDAGILENLGTLYLARGDLAAARTAFSGALALDPQRRTARRALAALDAAAPQR